MGHFKGLFSHFKARPRPVALENSPLNRLPNELLLCIIDHLPASSAASFSLSCLQIQHRIGNWYIQNLSGSTEDTVEFLNLLERDMQDQIGCSACKKLHKIKHARRYMENSLRPRWRQRPACVLRDWDNSNLLYLHDNFSSVVFKMAMKRYNQNNPEHAKLLKLLAVRMETGRGFDHIRKYSQQIRIINGSLFIRQQIAFHFLSTASFRARPFSNSFLNLSMEWWEASHWICPHLEFSIGRDSAFVSPLWASMNTWSTTVDFYDENDTQTHDISSGLKQCCHCRTEYQLNFKHYPGRGVVVFCTQWKELGAGPDHRTWKAHTRRIGAGVLFPPSIPFRIGEISSAFQKGEPFRFDSILKLGNMEGLLNGDAGRLLANIADYASYPRIVFRTFRARPGEMSRYPLV
jgi:hypothetical protein